MTERLNWTELGWRAHPYQSSSGPPAGLAVMAPRSPSCLLHPILSRKAGSWVRWVVLYLEFLHVTLRVQFSSRELSSKSSFFPFLLYDTTLFWAEGGGDSAFLSLLFLQDPHGEGRLLHWAGRFNCSCPPETLPPETPRNKWNGTLFPRQVGHMLRTTSVIKIVTSVCVYLLEKETATNSCILCLENSVDRGTFLATVHRVTESDTTEWLNMYTGTYNNQLT